MTGAALSDLESVVRMEEELNDPSHTKSAQLMRAYCLVRLRRFAEAAQVGGALPPGTKWFFCDSLYTRERILKLARGR